MKQSLLLKSISLMGLGALLLSGCVYRERVVYRQPEVATPEGEVAINEAPPPPIIEEMTVAPGPAFLWVGGFWAWRGHWVWEHGHWGRPPHPGAVWIGPRYGVRGGQHFYARGHWR